MNIYTQLCWLFILPIPIACISWTFTHEEILREPREYCIKQSAADKPFLKRKFFYLFTCEYCLSHYITIFFIWLTRYKLLMPDWKGYVIAIFAVVWIANLYMSLYGLLRQALQKEKTEIKILEDKKSDS